MKFYYGIRINDTTIAINSIHLYKTKCLAEFLICLSDTKTELNMSIVFICVRMDTFSHATRSTTSLSKCTTQILPQ